MWEPFTQRSQIRVLMTSRITGIATTIAVTETTNARAASENVEARQFQGA
jgi:hypothetical protein